jgi:H+/Cl- antiporter ClcA
MSFGRWAFAFGQSLAQKLLRRANAIVADHANLQAVGLWSAALATGGLAVLYASAFRSIESQAVQLIGFDPRWSFALGPPGFLGAWWLVRRFAPEAGGSGIPQVMAAAELPYDMNNSRFIDRLLGMRTAGVKIVSSLLCLAGGGAIGREGPTLQVGSAIFHFFGVQVRRFYPASDERTWVIAGSAAGLASAFNTPLGGIVYAIEELAITHFHRIRTALFSAVIISGLVSQVVLGSYLYLGYPVLKPMHASVWPFVFITGIVSGIAGAAFSRSLIYLLAYKRRLKKPVWFGAFALGCGVVCAALNYYSVENLGPGTPLINRILFSGEMATWAMTFSRMLATAVAYVSGAAGGVFSPSLTIGACLGSKIAYLAGIPNSNLLAMLGMIGFLTGLTQTPFTSFILVLEMSDRHSAIFPMMVTALAANAASRLISNHSFYELVKVGIVSDHRKDMKISPEAPSAPPLPQ